MEPKHVLLGVWVGLLFYFNQVFGIIIGGIILLGHYVDFVAYFPTKLRLFVQRDLRAAIGSIKVAIHTYLAIKRDRPIYEAFESTVRDYPNKTMFIYEDRQYTFGQMNDYANQVGNYFFTKENLQKGDCVALISPNCPQYVAIWLGLHKIGCITSLINTNLIDESLRHAIEVAECKMVIVGADLWKNYLTAKSRLSKVSRSFVFTEGKPLDSSFQLDDDVSWFDDTISKMPSTKPLVEPALRPHYFDKVTYIYTSGTTGLPKPCVITSHRAFVYSIAHHHILGIKTSDIIYCTLPLYHSAGGAILVGQAIAFGSTVVLRKNFSASRFWDDAVKYKCTVFHYVGELCRYLLAQPHNPKETQHSIRLMYGVGLRPQIWAEFVGRFGIPKIFEVYGSTEGNTGFVNLDGKVGAIGFTSPLVEFVKEQYFLKVDVATGEPLRGPDGLCIKCRANEPGELVGRISASKFNSFDGYLQKEATEKKYLRDVLKKGDLFFRTGDILMFDDLGYVYFVDRSGDTFRWKGENVSTTEVEGVISRLTGDVDVAVFGVLVPGCEGRAGMACIGHEGSAVDIDKLSQQVKEKLPSYARPLFLRFCKELQVTGTFKITKNALKDEGYDINRVGNDYLFFWNNVTGRYERLDTDSYNQINEGKMRF